MFSPYDCMTYVLKKYFAAKRSIKAAMISEPGPKLTDAFLRSRFVELISRDIGLRETYGKNRHNTIDNINIRMKLPLGSAYCLSGLLIRGVADLCQENDLYNPVLMLGSTQTWFQQVPKEYKGFDFMSAKVADICIMSKKSIPWMGHAYALRFPPENNVHHTAEYNTDNYGSDDGEGFHFLARNKDESKTMTYLGYVDVIKWIMKENNL